MEEITEVRTHTIFVLGMSGTSRIHLSKTAFDSYMSGSARTYTLLHEVAHGAGFGHNVGDRGYRFERIFCGGKLC